MTRLEQHEQSEARRPAHSQQLHREAYEDQRAAGRHGGNVLHEAGLMFTSLWDSAVTHQRARAAETSEAIDAGVAAVRGYGSALARENREIVQGVQQTADSLGRSAQRTANEVGHNIQRTANEVGHNIQRTADDVGERVDGARRVVDSTVRRTVDGSVRNTSDVFERTANHLRERPATASAEIVLGVVPFVIDSQVRGRTDEAVAAQRAEARRERTPAPPATPQPEAEERTRMTVRQGDSYWSIARRHLSTDGAPSNAEIHILSRELQQRNNDRALQPGQSIMV